MPPKKKDDDKEEHEMLFQYPNGGVYAGKCQLRKDATESEELNGSGGRPAAVDTSLSEGGGTTSTTTATPTITEQLRRLHYVVTPSGVGTYTDSSGASYEGSWREGVPDGEGSLYFPSGSVLSGSWSKGEIQSGVLRYPDGSLYEGPFVKNQFHGEGVYVEADGTRWRGVFADGEATDLKPELVL